MNTKVNESVFEVLSALDCPVFFVRSYDKFFSEHGVPALVLVYEKNSEKVHNYLLSKGYSHEILYKDKVALYDARLPIKYTLDNHAFILTYKLGYLSRVGNSYLPVTRDIQDSIFIDAKRVDETNCYVASVEDELTQIIALSIYEYSNDKELFVIRARELFAECDQNILIQKLHELFYKFDQKIIVWLKSADESMEDLAGSFYTNTDY